VAEQAFGRHYYQRLAEVTVDLIRNDQKKKKKLRLSVENKKGLTQGAEAYLAT
jgi:hypothetical protein